MNRYSIIRFVTFLLLILNKPTGSMYAQVVPPDPYNTNATINYVRTWQATAPEQNAAVLPGKLLREVKQTTAYIDGLGRPIQTVVKKGSYVTGNPNPTDVVSPVVYNNLNQEKYKYLHYVSTATDGYFKFDPFQQQIIFYNNYLTGQNETNTQNNRNWAYTQTDYEFSPMARVQKTTESGRNWHINNRGIENKYWSNTIADEVHVWSVADIPNGWGSYSTAGIYEAGKLYKNITIDENEKQVIEFIDQEGNIILKKVQLGESANDNGAGTGHLNWSCTYYVYDVLNNLRLVIQPNAVDAMANPPQNWVLDATMLEHQCFRYEYDSRNRLIRKKVPGAGEVNWVYDKRDRLVMVQDANLRTQGQARWMITLYDHLDRPVQTGLWTNANDVIYHNNQATNGANLDYPFSVLTVPGSGYEYLSKVGYDTYSTIPFASGLSATFDNSFNSYLHTTYNASPLFAEQLLASSDVNGLVTWTESKVIGTSSYLYSVNIYDNKDRVIQVKTKNITGGTDISTLQYNFSGQPLVTISKIEKAGTPNAQTHIIINKSEYDDLGRILNVKKTISSIINGQAVTKPETEILRNEYDELGRLKNKKLSPNYNVNSSPGLETLSYEYNVRGWLLGVNRSFLETPDKTDRWFGFDLGYENVPHAYYGYYNTQQFNGNITGTVWKSKGDKIARKYDFAYDAANRFLRADFNQQNNGGMAWEHNDADFSVKMGNGSTTSYAYDPNGNILQMQQWGLKLGAVSQIDNMKYTYLSGTNRLKSVTDFNNDAQTKLGDFRTAMTHPQSSAKTSLTINSPQASFDLITDYSYDLNGNLTYDNNKDIINITYNHLNLPSIITFSGDRTISYTYDAGGGKQKKTVYEPNATIKYNGVFHSTSITTITTYFGGMVFESKDFGNSNLINLKYTDRLQYLIHEEGRVRFELASPSTCPVQSDRFIYDYFVKDHLGNIRMVVTEQNEDICYIPATVEDNRQVDEQQIYNIVDTRRVLKSTVPNASNIPSFEQRIYRTNGGLSAEKTGLGMVLKVMSGDKVKIYAESFYNPPPNNDPGPPQTLTLIELLTSLVTSNTIVSSTHSGVTESDISNLGANFNNLSSFISNHSAGPSTAEAFLNWILFDDQLRYIDGDVDVVQPGGYYKLHSKFINTPVNVSKNGYLFVFVSNESNLPVYFDNLTVTHTPGPLIEENHYYPFGLVMSGISSKALLKMENKVHFNGYEQQNKEFNDGSGLEWYDYKHRFYDNQVGRFFCIDALADQYPFYTPYQFAGNEVPNVIDLDGLEPAPKDPGLYEMQSAQTKGIGGTGHPGGYGMVSQNWIWHEGGVNGSKPKWYTEDRYFEEILKPIGKAYNRVMSGNGDEDDNNLYSEFLATRKGNGNYHEILAQFADYLKKNPTYDSWARWIPIWGSLKQAYLDFSVGKYGWGTFNAVMGVSDFFLVKSVFNGAIKGGVTGLTKNYKWWGSWRAYYGGEGAALKGQHMHHWFWEREGAKSGSGFGWWFQNQRWNLMVMQDSKLLGLSGSEVHTLVHGKTLTLSGYSWKKSSLWPVYKYIYGTPTWFKTSINYGVGQGLNSQR